MGVQVVVVVTVQMVPAREDRAILLTLLQTKGKMGE
jgi:hypothetical protein